MGFHAATGHAFHETLQRMAADRAGVADGCQGEASPESIIHQSKSVMLCRNRPIDVLRADDGVEDVNPVRLDRSLGSLTSDVKGMHGQLNREVFLTAVLAGCTSHVFGCKSICQADGRPLSPGLVLVLVSRVNSPPVLCVDRLHHKGDVHLVNAPDPREDDAFGVENRHCAHSFVHGSPKRALGRIVTDVLIQGPLVVRISTYPIRGRVQDLCLVPKLKCLGPSASFLWSHACCSRHARKSFKASPHQCETNHLGALPVSSSNSTKAHNLARVDGRTTYFTTS